jgi:RNA polymerase sigma-70 factor (ECF subfamily)
MAASIDDPAAFGEIATAHADAVYQYLARRVGHGLAEDLTAEVFLSAFRARSTYQPEFPTVLPWLYGVASNVLRNHQRSELRRLDMLGRMAAESRFMGSSAESIDDAVIFAAAAQRVAAAVTALQPDWRDVVLLIAVQGLSYEDAALAVNAPVGTVRSRLFRAREQLRRELADVLSTKSPSYDERGHHD